MTVPDEAMENIAPPQPALDPKAPKPAGAEDFERLRDPDLTVRGRKSLIDIAASYIGSCSCRHAYANNCAHFLAHAFIDAGWTELSQANPIFNARCGTKRPIRAREMRDWFRSVSTSRTNKLDRNTGYWAVFQLDEQVYWGGHVCIVDTDAWRWYGTGFYPNWTQDAFKW